VASPFVAAQQRASAELELRRRRRERAALGLSSADFATKTMIAVPQGEGVAAMPFTLWPAQRDVLAKMDTERFLLFLKARQLGISWLACLSSLHRCLTRKGQVILMFSQGQEEADELVRRVRFLYTHHQEVASLPALVTDNTSRLEWSNTSRVVSLPATKRAGRSWTASRVIMDEFAFMQYGSDVLAAVEPTVNDGGSLWIISSADGQGTPYHQLWQLAAAGSSRYQPVFLPWTANPNRPPDFRQQLLETAPDKATVKREYPENADEAFIHAAGLIYDVWSDGPEDGNVTEAADYIPDGGRVLWGVDDGYAGQLDPKTGTFTANSHPRVFLWVQQRTNGQVCIFDESYACGLQSDAHLDQVLAMPYPQPEAAGVDKSAAELKGRIWNAGIQSLTGPTSVEESTKVLRRFIAPDRNGVRMLLVHPRCKHFRKEMASYRSDATTQQPIKAFDHGPDAARYIVWPLRFEQ
jgi:hypothetical protein